MTPGSILGAALPPIEGGNVNASVPTT